MIKSIKTKSKKNGKKFKLTEKLNLKKNMKDGKFMTVFCVKRRATFKHLLDYGIGS